MIKFTQELKKEGKKYVLYEYSATFQDPWGDKYVFDSVRAARSFRHSLALVRRARFPKAVIAYVEDPNL